MSDTLLLDTLDPPAPDQLVADCRSVGAAGCWVYAARFDTGGANVGIGTWTPAHVQALHTAGLVAPAIIVPGSQPGTVQPMLDAADALGCDPQTAFDIETFSLPSPNWLTAAFAVTRLRSRRPLRYGDAAVLAGYPLADGDWWSHGAIPVRAGWSPADGVPPLPPGLVADQFAVQVTINGHDYDVSVADSAVFGGMEEDMKAVVVIGPNGTQWVVLPSGHRFGVSSQEDLATLVATGQYVQGGNVSQAQLDQIPLLSSAASSQLLNHQHSIPGGQTGLPEVPV